MASATAVAKREYQNQTSGWIGVVKLDHLGQEIGHSVEPGGSVWLSDDEALLTARAPQRPEDNPFLERDFRHRDINGDVVTTRMASIVLISDESRTVYGSERFVPGIAPDATPAAPSAPVIASAPVPAPEVPSEDSWVQPPVAPGQVLPGRLRGSNDAPAPSPLAAAAPTPSPAEEHASHDAMVVEEHGANTNGHAEVQGEYAMAEETGTDQLGENATDDGEGLIS